MAKKSGNSGQHSIHSGLSSSAASQKESSMSIKSSRSVNDEATRDTVATCHGTGHDGGKLK